MSSSETLRQYAAKTIDLKSSEVAGLVASAFGCTTTKIAFRASREAISNPTISAEERARLRSLLKVSCEAFSRAYKGNLAAISRASGISRQTYYMILESI